jgi:hypothetical protein
VYGTSSPAKAAGHGTKAVAVQVTASGLLPGTVYHYRLTATSRFGTTIGADRTFKTAGHPPFVTFASPRFTPRISARTNPRHDRFSPYVFTTTGTVRPPSNVPPALACSGNVTVRFFFRGRTISFGLVPLQTNCTFSSQAVFRHLPGRGKKRRIVNIVAVCK